MAGVYKPLPDCLETYTDDSDANGGYAMNNPYLGSYLKKVDDDIRRAEYFNRGYRAGVRDGYEQAIKDVRTLIEKHNLGGMLGVERTEKRKRGRKSRRRMGENEKRS